MFKCENCLQQFSSNSNKLKHERNVHSTEKKAKQQEKFEQSSTRPYGCLTCNQFFSTISNKNRHEKNTHFEVFEKFVDCDLCEKTFASKGNLKLHMQSQHIKVNKKGKQSLKNESIIIIIMNEPIVISFSVG